jgi:hypothetical protein
MARMGLRTILVCLSISGAAWGQAKDEAPDPLAYDASGPMVSRYEPQSHPRWGLVIAGGVMLGAGYGFAVVGAVDTKFKDKGGFLLIPVVGPLVTILAGGAKGSCPPSTMSCAEHNDQGKTFVLGLDTAVQAAGALMLTLGIVFPRRRLEPTDMSLNVLPVALGNGGYGAGVVGSF